MKKSPCVGFRPLKVLGLRKTNTWAGWAVWGWGVRKHGISFRGPPIDKVMWEVLPKWPSPRALLPPATASSLCKIKHSLLLSKCFLESSCEGRKRVGVGDWMRKFCTFAWPKSEHRGEIFPSLLWTMSFKYLFQSCPTFYFTRAVVTLK